MYRVSNFLGLKHLQPLNRRKILAEERLLQLQPV